MFPSMRGLLSSWHKAFVGKKRRKVWQIAHFCLFGQFGTKEIVGFLAIKSNLFRESRLFFVTFGL